MDRHEPAIPAPAFLRRWQTWSMLLVLMLFPFFIRIPKALNHHPVISPIGDQVHIFLLGGVALLVYWVGPLRGRLWWAAGAAALIGGAVEFLQLLVGRQALFTDFLLDLVGIGLVVGWVLWRGHGNRAGRALFLVLLLSIPVQLYYLPMRIAATYHSRDLFPVLADFGRWSDRYLWHANMEADLTFPEIDDAPGGSSRVLRLDGGPPTHWPGAVLKRFPDDWSTYRELQFDVRLVRSPGPEARLGVRIDDYEGLREDKWTSQNFAVSRQWQTMTMPIRNRRLHHSERDLDLTQVDRIIFYFGKPSDSLAVQIDNIQLQ